MQTDLSRYLPSFYDEIRETAELVKVENEMFDELRDQTKITVENQFILTCDEGMLSLWEDILQINFNPDTDTEEFRRDRIINRLASRSAMTLWFLKERLDVMLGRENYDIIINHDDYEMLIRSAIDNQALYNEVILTVYRIKPANIAFILVPVVYKKVIAKESANIRAVEYKRAGFWFAGVTPIERIGEAKEVHLW